MHIIYYARLLRNLLFSEQFEIYEKNVYKSL